MSSASHVAHSPDAHAPEHDHPSGLTYVKVGAVLAVLTAIEIGTLYVEVLEPWFVPILLSLAIVKFAIVVAFYMHLKFDHRLFTYVFGFGLLIATGIITALMILFAQNPLPPTPEPTIIHH